MFLLRSGLYRFAFRKNKQTFFLRHAGIVVKAVCVAESPVAHGVDFVMSNPFQPAIDELENEAKNLETQLRGLTTTINFLRQKAGLPPRGPGGGGSQGEGDGSNGVFVGLNIQPDTYFSKKMSTAAREYLSARKAAGMPGPAMVKEIFEALKLGGLQFGSKDDTNAKIVLGSMLRKYSATFQKMPNGSYGLKAWYPDAKKPRAAQVSQDDEQGEANEITPEEAFAGVNLSSLDSGPPKTHFGG